MKWIIEHGQIVGVELTRRNLETLLAKLDRNVRREEHLALAGSADTLIEHSECTISKEVFFETDQKLMGVPVVTFREMFVRSVENEAHYEAEGRAAGRMYDDEEAVISRPKTGVA